MGDLDRRFVVRRRRRAETSPNAARSFHGCWRCGRRRVATNLPAAAEGAVDLDQALADYLKARQGLDALADSKPDSGIIHPQYVTRLGRALS